MAREICKVRCIGCAAGMVFMYQIIVKQGKEKIVRLPFSYGAKVARYGKRRCRLEWYDMLSMLSSQVGLCMWHNDEASEREM